MEYWSGAMNWPMDAVWKCEICGEQAGLTWGLIHAQCRCNKCHTQYAMRDDDGNVVTKPICILKDEYYEPAKSLYAKYKTPMSEWTEEQWEEV